MLATNESRSLSNLSIPTGFQRQSGKAVAKGHIDLTDAGPDEPTPPYYTFTRGGVQGRETYLYYLDNNLFTW